jgi:hypothetical protein
VFRVLKCISMKQDRFRSINESLDEHGPSNFIGQLYYIAMYGYVWICIGMYVCMFTYVCMYYVCMYSCVRMYVFNYEKKVHTLSSIKYTLLVNACLALFSGTCTAKERMCCQGRSLKGWDMVTVVYTQATGGAVPQPAKGPHLDAQHVNTP